jgi:hypothetical protein
VPEILRVLMTIVHEARRERAAAVKTTIPA